MSSKAKYRKDYKTPDFTALEIHLDFKINPDTTEVIATTLFKKMNPAATSLELIGHSFRFASIKLNNSESVSYEQTNDTLIIDLTAITDDTFTLEITTILSPATNTSLQGLYQSGDGLCTQCEAEGFRQITYSLDRPDVLAKYTTKITADKLKYPHLLSNGNCIERGELADGKHWVVWQDPFPKPSYLFALVAGDFDLLEDTFTTKSNREVKLEIFVDKGNLKRAYWAMESLKQSMKWDEERFNLEYDLDIYMVVAVDFFNMGAMENKGLNIFNSRAVLATSDTSTDEEFYNVRRIIGHEYFHNWTGNRITCRDWFQLSLKEGLTVFREQEFCSDIGSRVINRITAAQTIRTLQFAEDASPMSHPIRPDKVIEMNNFYTMTVYEKGSEVIRMLHTLIGEDLFQAGMRRYIELFDGQAVTCDDFVDAMEQASGVDLTQFRRWYSQSGTPKLTVSDEYDEKQHIYRLHVKQHTAPTYDQMEKVNLHIPFKIAIYSDDGKLLPLQYNGVGISDVLDVLDENQTFEFHGIYAKPVPALLCNFSAPVKLEYNYTSEQLLCLVKYAQDDFGRWDAAQVLYANELKANLDRYLKNEPLELSTNFINVLQSVLDNYATNLELTTMILTVPKETEFAELFTIIDPTAIHEIRYFICQQLSANFKDAFLAIYNANSSVEYNMDGVATAKRALMNLCLSYLAFTADGDELVANHYYSANNMTNTIAAMKAACYAKLDCCEALLADYDKKWSHDGLVMDKYFAIQATRPIKDVSKKVIELMSHPTFNIANPNRVRALVGNFASQNPCYFHALDGSGYRLLVDVLVILNDKNPQTAARLIDPLIKLSRYDSARQLLMKRSLQRLEKLDNLANDLFEKISKALEE